MSEDHKACIRAFLDRVLTAGEINATGDYCHRDREPSVAEVRA
jgi:hypothetical protein